MARASKAKSRQDAKSVTQATAEVTGAMLRLAAEAGTGTDQAGEAAAITQLVGLCEEAAEHMAKAQTRMFEGKDGGESAIAHLDAALQCLNRLAEAGERHTPSQNRAAKSA